MSAVQPRFLLLTASCCLLWISSAGAATLPAGFSETPVATRAFEPHGHGHRARRPGLRGTKRRRAARGEEQRAAVTAVPHRERGHRRVSAACSGWLSIPTSRATASCTCTTPPRPHPYTTA